MKVKAAGDRGEGQRHQRRDRAISEHAGRQPGLAGQDAASGQQPEGGRLQEIEQHHDEDAGADEGEYADPVQRRQWPALDQRVDRRGMGEDAGNRKTVDDLGEARRARLEGAARLIAAVEAVGQETPGRDRAVLDIERSADQNHLAAEMAGEIIGVAGPRAGPDIGEAVNRHRVGRGVEIDQEVAVRRSRARAGGKLDSE